MRIFLFAACGFILFAVCGFIYLQRADLFCSQCADLFSLQCILFCEMCNFLLYGGILPGKMCPSWASVDTGYECSMPPSWMIKLTEGWGEPKKD